MKSKKAWLRIMEAFIAVLIIASVLLVSITRIPRGDRSEEIHELQRAVLEQISFNDVLRGEVVNNNMNGAENFVRQTIPSYFNFTLKICEVEEICGMPFYVEKDVYADEILISSTLEDYQPKKLKIFMWEK